MSYRRMIDYRERLVEQLAHLGWLSLAILVTVALVFVALLEVLCAKCRTYAHRSSVQTSAEKRE